MNSRFYKTKKGIESWLNQYKITNYTLIPDEKYGFIIDVKNNVDLTNKNLTWIPVKFNKVSGDFNCSENKLKSLEFCPITIDGDFNCSYNQLTSLEFCPTTLNGYFDCSHNKLKSLEFCPTTVNGDFHFFCNKLKSLEFCPTTVSGNFHFANNQIENLLFFPSKIDGFCNSEDNPNLGDFQNESDFKKLYAEHKKQLIEKFKYEVELEVGLNMNSDKINKNKPKI